MILNLLYFCALPHVFPYSLNIFHRHVWYIKFYTCMCARAINIPYPRLPYLLAGFSPYIYIYISLYVQLPPHYSTIQVLFFCIYMHMNSYTITKKSRNWANRQLGLVQKFYLYIFFGRETEREQIKRKMICKRRVISWHLYSGLKSKWNYQNSLLSGACANFIIISLFLNIFFIHYLYIEAKFANKFFCWFKLNFKFIFLVHSCWNFHQK